MDRHGEEVLVHGSGGTRSLSVRTLLDVSGAFVPLIVTFDTWVQASVFSLTCMDFQISVTV